MNQSKQILHHMLDVHYGIGIEKKTIIKYLEFNKLIPHRYISVLKNTKTFDESLNVFNNYNSIYNPQHITIQYTEFENLNISSMFMYTPPLPQNNEIKIPNTTTIATLIYNFISSFISSICSIMITSQNDKKAIDFIKKNLKTIIVSDEPDYD